LGAIMKLRAIDPKVVYLLLFIVLAVPLIRPIGLPIEVSMYAQRFYNQVEALKPGALVFYSLSFTVAKTVEFYPQMVAVTQHLVAKKARIVYASWLVDNPPLVEKLFTDLSFEKRGLKYGTDYVHLGFIPGVATGMASFARDVHKTVGADYGGKPVGDLPLMAEAKKAQDFVLLVGFLSINFDQFVGQIQTPYKLPLVVGTDGVSFAGMLPYLSAGQVMGILNSMIGAAEYEALIRVTGKGTGYMDAQQMSHFLIIALVIVGNVAMIMQRGSRRESR